MKLPRRLRTCSTTGASLRRASSMSAPRTVSLVSIAGRHDAGTSTEEVLHLVEPFLVEHELDTCRLRRDLLGKIIDCGPEPAVDDDGIDALAGELERLEQRLAVVADRSSPDDL